MSTLALVVEDHAVVRLAVRDILIAQGFTVMTADSVAAASRLILGRGANFSFLVTDIHLPDGNGWNVARVARSTLPRLQVLYMSAEAQAEFADQAVPHSAFVAKPFAVEELTCALACLGVESQPIALAVA